MTKLILEKKNLNISATKMMKRAALIDDEPIINRLNKKILHSFHMESECFNNLDCLKKDYNKSIGTFDILIIDFNLIQNDNNSIPDTLKKINEKIPVLITSGHLKNTANKFLKNYKKIEYIQKPYTLEEFHSKIKKLLEV